MPSRQIIFDSDCDVAAKALGGYERIDRSLDGSWQSLLLEPREFPIVETLGGSVRYIRTKKISNGVPELLWYFIIDEKEDVILVHVEEYTS
jgi:hypothetical protein